MEYWVIVYIHCTYWIIVIKSKWDDFRKWRNRGSEAYFSIFFILNLPFLSFSILFIYPQILAEEDRPRQAGGFQFFGFGAMPGAWIDTWETTLTNDPPQLLLGKIWKNHIVRICKNSPSGSCMTEWYWMSGYVLAALITCCNLKRRWNDVETTLKRPLNLSQLIYHPRKAPARVHGEPRWAVDFTARAGVATSCSWIWHHGLLCACLRGVSRMGQCWAAMLWCELLQPWTA